VNKKEKRKKDLKLREEVQYLMQHPEESMVEETRELNLSITLPKICWKITEGEALHRDEPIERFLAIFLSFTLASSQGEMMGGKKKTTQPFSGTRRDS
jgi:hypothetical protein